MDIGTIEENKNIIHPATKEQRDTLERVITNAGYRWNANKKELKKIEQKPAWSEEDEEMLLSVIADIKYLQISHTHEVDQVVYEEKIDWLKSLKSQSFLK